MGQRFSSKLKFSLLFFIVGLVGVVFTVSCRGEERLDTIELQIGRDSYRVEVARTPEERQKGLMFREKLGEFEGMFFVFEQDRHLGFWMKNTYMPLSIAYIASDGTIRAIYDMQPLSERTIESGYAVRYALELPQGAFEKSGVEIGDRINIPEGLE